MLSLIVRRGGTEYVLRKRNIRIKLCPSQLKMLIEEIELIKQRAQLTMKLDLAIGFPGKNMFTSHLGYGLFLTLKMKFGEVEYYLTQSNMHTKSKRTMRLTERQCDVIKSNKTLLYEMFPNLVYYKQCECWKAEMKCMECFPYKRYN